MKIKPTKVLLVEDSDTDATVVLSLLEKSGVVALRASSLAQVIPLAHTVDMLLVDLVLSDSDIETTLIELVSHCNRPILILTGVADTSVAHRFGQLGVLGTYLVKPVNYEQLSASIAWACGLYERWERKRQRINDITSDKDPE